MVDGNTTYLTSLLFNVSYVFMYKPRRADAMAGISGSDSDLQAKGDGRGTRFDPAPWTGPCRREREDEGEREKEGEEGEREKEGEEGEREREVNAVDSSRSRAPTAYPKGVHRQPAQCPDSPRSTTGDAVGCLQAPSRPLLSLPEEGLWFSTSLLLVLKFRYPS